MPRFGERRLLRNALEAGIFRAAGVLDPAHFLRWKYFCRALVYVIPEPKRILDAGSGSGDYALWLARSFPGSEVVGIDVDRQRVANASSDAAALGLTNVTFHHAGIEEFSDEPFDFLYSIDVLEHVQNQTAALKNLASLLTPEGTAYFHVPTIREKPVLLSTHLHGFHAWAAKEHVHDDLTVEGFLSTIQDAGFEPIQQWRTFGRWTGELATSIFALPWGNSKPARLAQLGLSPLCRLLAMGDQWSSPRYAFGVVSRRTR